ncbi:hypothetical protein H4Q26_004476 [Puccinia striiformis f. sp. tritici PST-130]|nr:hypothetical protein H4Q26_004476 [Puccinia striiformis f. sp. tritici PST-130]
MEQQQQQQQSTKRRRYRKFLHSHLGVRATSPLQENSSGNALKTLFNPTHFQLSDSATNLLPSLSKLEDLSPVDKIIRHEHQKLTYGNSAFYPPPDLQQSLLEIYFQYVHPLLRIIHPASFIQDFKAGRGETDDGFKALCLIIFSVASRFSQDPRVYLDLEGNPHPSLQTAGLRYCISAGCYLLRPIPSPATFYELQAFALMVVYSMGAVSPGLLWCILGVALQRAQIAGAHQEDNVAGLVLLSRIIIVERLYKSLIQQLDSSMTNCFEKIVVKINLHHPTPNLMSDAALLSSVAITSWYHEFRVLLNQVLFNSKEKSSRVHESIIKEEEEEGEESLDHLLSNNVNLYPKMIEKQVLEISLGIQILNALAPSTFLAGKCSEMAIQLYESAIQYNQQHANNNKSKRSSTSASFSPTASSSPSTSLSGPATTKLLNQPLSNKRSLIFITRSSTSFP